MEHLWAPWRNTYVRESVSDTRHLFAEIAASSDDEAHLVVFRSKACFVLLNRYPYNLGHLMVLPTREVSELSDLSEAESADLWATVNRAVALLKKAFQPHGYNIGLNLGTAAGAGIPTHLHVHIVPRWTGDANYMTTTGGTRVHPGDLPTAYRQLRTALETT
jgi:ATP adenylyltransferase